MSALLWVYGWTAGRQVNAGDPSGGTLHPLARRPLRPVRGHGLRGALCGLSVLPVSTALSTGRTGAGGGGLEKEEQEASAVGR